MDKKKPLMKGQVRKSIISQEQKAAKRQAKLIAWMIEASRRKEYTNV